MEKKKLSKMELKENSYNAAIEMTKDLIKDPQLIRQKKTFEMILKSLCHAAENDKNLTLKNRKLQSEISSNSSKIRAAIQLSREDEATIAMLKEELEKSWALAKELRTKLATPSKHPNEFNINLNQHQSQSHQSQSHQSQKSTSSDYNASGDFNRMYLKEISSLEVEKQNFIDEIKTLKNHLINKDKDTKIIKEEKGKISLEVDDLKQLRQKDLQKIQLIKDNLHDVKSEFKMAKQENDKLLSEIEKNKLQIFELEEELSHKEKLIEELTLKDGKEVSKHNLNTENILNNGNLLQSDIWSTSFLSENTIKNDFTELKKMERKVKSMTSKLVKANNLYRHIKSNLILQKTQFFESMNSLNTVRAKNDLLSKEVEEKTKLCTVLLLENKKLRNEITKFTLSINLLEDIRDNYVFTMGKLENETHNLKTELAKWKKW